MNDFKKDELRREIGFLGTVLGDTIREFAGDEALRIVEILRRAAWDRRVGGESADQRIKDLVAELDEEQMKVVIRAFSIFLDLLNLVEDRRRVEVLDQRARSAYPGPRSESIRAAITELKNAGKSAAHVQSLIDNLQVDLVFTAHPTDAKRRSVRSKLRAIRRLMEDYDSDQLPQAQDQTEREIRAEIAKLWQTDFIRPWRPSVMQEVARGLSIKPVLWNEVPRIAENLDQALQENYGTEVRAKRSSVIFGSWIGGDRDGHPGVTAEVTQETFLWLRREALAFHLKTCGRLIDSLSISDRQVHISPDLQIALDEAVSKWPDLKPRMELLPPSELLRRWLLVIQWRLQQSQSENTDGDSYSCAAELADDVAVLESAINALPASRYIIHEVHAWQTQIETFGLHLARLDIRQNASVYSEVLNELLRSTGQCSSPESLDEQARCAALLETFDPPLVVQEQSLSSMTTETLSLFRTLHQVACDYSMSAIGTHVISMTSAPSDVLTVLWLWQRTAGDGERVEENKLLPIVPLLETIEDLRHGPDILKGMLSIPQYREYLRGQGDRQMVMLGYSDSTKDGGYLSACWSLHQAQQELVEVAEKHGVQLTFFHGRGGSLGRGGGPAARSILSLPRGTFDGHLRLTEQGEVLADRYDDPAIAHRHLEQVLWSSLLAAGDPVESDSQQWYSTMASLAETSFQSYRQLLEQPGFVEFFRRVTPISEIEQLPIGSRPSRRKPDGGLADLRAIPWVFSWTQSRCLIPAWYGIGSAMGDAVNDETLLSELRTMYRQWPFFRALVDNAELALAKSDLQIAGEYASLAEDIEHLETIGSMIAKEIRESCRVILALTGRKDLLDGTPWLKESIRVRNRFIDPLNLIQVELLRRAQRSDKQSAEEQEERRHLTRLSINGVAAGMRTSG